MEPDAEDDFDNPERIRHAETPELAREALIDSVVLIFKSQVEVAFREQTAGHNALLLFVHLALQMMEEQLLNAFKELRAKQAEVQLPLNIVYPCQFTCKHVCQVGADDAYVARCICRVLHFVQQRLHCMMHSLKLEMYQSVENVSTLLAVYEELAASPTVQSVHGDCALLQAELLEALEEEQKQQESKKTAKKKKKSAVKGADKADSVDSPSDASDSQKVTVSPEPAAPPACTRCALLQGPQKLNKKGKACCAGCKTADSKQPSPVHPSKPSVAAVRGLSSPHSHMAHSPVSVPSGLQRLSSSSSSSVQSASTSIHYSSGSRSPTEPGTPSSSLSQQSDDGWEVQQRSKRVSAALEKQLSVGSHGFTSQPRACTTVPATHLGLAAAWQSVAGTSPHANKPHMKDVLVHHVHVNPGSSETLHLASGPVSFQPPPPPPPPRTRVAAPASSEGKAPHSATQPTPNAWNVDTKSAALVSRNAWNSAVQQVIAPLLSREVFAYVPSTDL